MKNKELYEVVNSVPSNIRIFETVVKPPAPTARRIHWHEHVEFYFILEGSGTVICGDGLLEVKKDEFVIVNSSELHHGAAGGYCRYLCIMLPPSFFEGKYIFKNHFCDDYVKELMYKIYNEYNSDNEGKNFAIKGYTYFLISYLIKKYSVVHLTEARHRQHIEKLERINSITKYIRENYKENLTTAGIADFFHMSEGHLCHSFKEITGKTIKKYINSVRIEKASDLIIASDMSILEIALSCGFNDVNYFSRCFKKIKGSCPTSLRE